MGERSKNMSPSSQTRDSNMELLRIVATFFILIVHCNGWLLNDFNELSWKSGSLAAQISRPIIQAISCIGVDLFILISGFFSIRPKLKSIINLFSVLFFFYVGTYIWRCAMGCVSFNLGMLFYHACAFSRENWFIQAYLFLMLLSPILNAFVESVDKKKLSLFVLVYAGCALYFSCIKHSTYFYFNDGYSVTCFILLYLIGRYIRLYLRTDLERIPSLLLWVGYVFSTLILSLSYFLGTIGPINLSGFAQYDSLFVIIPAVLLFLLFGRISFSSRFVNFIGKSCLAVFILHTCEPVVSWLARVDGALFMSQPYFLYFIKMLVIIIGVFIASTLLDKIRLLLFSPILSRINK